MKKIKKDSVLFITSDIYYVKVFLANQILEASKYFDVYLIVNADKQSVFDLFGNCVSFKHINIQRKISLFNDFISFLALVFFLMRTRPSIVHSTTPKAGLLSMVSSFITFIPFRMHTFTGQVWQTKFGIFRLFLKLLDRLTAITATHVLCDSHSQRDILISEGVLDEKKSYVILNGSIRGINSEKFSPNLDYRTEVRESMGIPSESTIILYMARFTRDKGALLMAQAFQKLALINPNLFLVMIGPDEENLAIDISALLINCKTNYRILSFTNSPEKYFASCDIFCLPSYREGFPMVLLNAAASGVPVVASRIYGTSDVVLDNKTGLLFNPGDLHDLVDKLAQITSDNESMVSFGFHARSFAISNFSESAITEILINIYRNRSFPE